MGGFFAVAPDRRPFNYKACFTAGSMHRRLIMVGKPK